MPGILNPERSRLLHTNSFLCLRYVYFLCTLCLFTFALLNCRGKFEPVALPTGPLNSCKVEGHVCDALGPVSGALVRVQTTEQYAYSDDHGHFILDGLPLNASIVLTAWAPGYYIGGAQPYAPGADSIVITLEQHTTEDNPDYQWISAFSAAGESDNCQICHSEGNSDNGLLPFDEWRDDAHAQSAQNVRFLTMYLGTDVYGNQSPRTRYVYNRDYGSFPLPPNLNEPYFGPGYKLDFPATTGNCAACHTPSAAIDNPYGIDPSCVSDVDAEGIGCDFCHKVWDVRLNPSTGVPYENMPGVLSLEFRRPPEGHQFFSGPLDDVAPGEDTYTPVQRESRYCAPCHFATFWGVEIYNSYGEWLDSPYSHPESGRTCQDCHMPSGRTDHFARPDKGGLHRDPNTIFSHRMPGAMDRQLMREAATMTMTTERRDTLVVVSVEIVNDNTGHHIPTDSPLRHLILVIRATDEDGNRLVQTEGPVLPDWCGVGDPDTGYYAGLAGKVYAKILQDIWTNISPTGAYWNMTRIVSDNRIAAFDSDVTSCSFQVSTGASINVEALLLFRRAYIQIMDWKHWDTPDILMAHLSETVQ